MNRLMAALSAIALVLAVQAQARAQAAEDVELGDGASARYRTPEGPMSNVAYLVVHHTSDYRDHVATTALQSRGFATLGIRSRFGDRPSIVWDRIALDVRNGVRFLRAQPRITKVVLIGHSGGGPAVSFYQAVAEAGPAYCRAPRRLSPCTLRDGDITHEDRADAVVLLDAHVSNGANLLRRLYPSEPVTAPSAEVGGMRVGHVRYAGSYVDRYSQAQSRRMNRLISKAQRIRREIARGTRGSADDAFPVDGVGPRLSELDPTILGHTLRPVKLLKDNGLIVRQVVHSTRPVDPDVWDEEEPSPGVEKHTVTSFLGAFAIRSSHALHSLDWCSSNNSTPCAVSEISVPVLVIAAQGHYFVRDGEVIHRMAASADKAFVVVEGLTHRLQNCLDCTGKPTARASENLWAYIVGWTVVRLTR